MSAPAERAMAEALGLPRYTTGKPCLHGHIAERDTVSGSCTVCRLERGRHHEEENRVERRRKNRDRKRAKKIGANFEVIPSTPSSKASASKPISLAAYEGVDTEVEGLEWIDGQAERLHVTADIIVGAIRNRWTLVEIEQLSREDAGQLADRVSEHKFGQGFEGYDAHVADMRDME